MPRGGARAGAGGKRAGAGRKPGVVRYGAPRRLRTRSGTREVISKENQQRNQNNQQAHGTCLEPFRRASERALLPASDETLGSGAV